MTTLERRYRWLLRAYPAGYRQDREAEMLDTLIESAGPDRAWPPVREVRTLVLGGLRVRSNRGERPTTAAMARQVGLLGVALFLVGRAALDLNLQTGLTSAALWTEYGTALASLTGAAGLWLGRRSVAVAALIVALLAIGPLVSRLSASDLTMLLEPAAVMALAAMLTKPGQRLPRSWLCLPVVVFAIMLFSYLPLLSIPERLLLPEVLLFGSLAVAILWGIVDARMLAGLGLWLALSVSDNFLWFLIRFGPLQGLLDLSHEVVIAAAVTAAALWRLRRQAVW